MSSILVTGAAGFIGRHLVRALAPHHEVVGLVKSDCTGDWPAGVRCVEQDLTQPLAIGRLPGRIDAVVHLAQSRFYRQFPDEAGDIFEVNLGGTLRLLEYARRAGARHFVFASSGGIYGYSYERFVESDPPRPLNFYLSTKYGAELLIANYQPFFHTVVLRFFFVYGPGQEGMLVPTLIRKVQTGQEVVIDGAPGIRVNPIHVTDAVRVFEPAMSLQASALFNVAGDEILTITGLVGLIEKATGRKAKVRHTATSAQGDLVGDTDRMKKLLHIRLTKPLIEGLREMAGGQ